jgi:hypothetical protein
MMFNPFTAFRPDYLDGFIKKGIRAFVQQSYPRGATGDGRLAFLLSHYDDTGLAIQHLDALKHDDERKIYLLSDLEQHAALKALLNNQQVNCFARLTIAQLDQRLKKVIEKKLHYFIDHHTDLRPKGYDSVLFNLEIIFGEVYVLIRNGARQIKVKLAEIEKPVYVL